MKRGEKAIKKPNIHTKVGKYFMAVKSGKTKKEAQIVAGFADTAHPTRIENTKEYQALTNYFKDDLLKQTSVSAINSQIVDNIFQPGQEKKDRNASNKAIEIARDIIEPKNSPNSDEDETKVLIVLGK